jgi:hypothetical protein
MLMLHHDESHTVLLSFPALLRVSIRWMGSQIYLRGREGIEFNCPYHAMDDAWMDDGWWLRLVAHHQKNVDVDKHYHHYHHTDCIITIVHYNLQYIYKHIYIYISNITVEDCTEVFANIIGTGDITFTWFTLPIGIQYQGMRTFCGRGEMSETPKQMWFWEGQPYRTFGRKSQSTISFVPTTIQFFILPMASTKMKVPLVAAIDQCVLGSETVSTKNNGDF